MSTFAMIPQLLAACPSASAAWAAHLEYWGADPRGDFNDLDVFAHHVVKSYREGHTGELPAFFQTLEAFLASPDEDVVGLAKYGLVETIQNIASHQPFGGQVFLQWCLAKTQVAWQSVVQEWQGKSSLAQVLRTESNDGS